jgi:hypothetical protein
MINHAAALSPASPVLLQMQVAGAIDAQRINKLPDQVVHSLGNMAPR